MRARSGSLLRKSFALIALLLVAGGGIVATQLGARYDMAAAGIGGPVGFADVPRQSGPFVPPVFGPNVLANSDGSGFGQHEPSLAVSRTNPNFVVTASKDYRQGNVKHVWIDVSTDGGATWPANKQLQVPGIPPAFTIQSDPVVMARDDGRIYVACLATDNGTSIGGVYITWSDDGSTWTTPSVPVYATENTLDDKDWFAIDNSPASPYYHRMYMMYAPGANDIVEQHSTDGGMTWSTRQQISASDTEYTYPVVAGDGTVYNFMMLHWGAGRTGTVQMTRSTNGGVTWSSPSTVATAEQPQSSIRPGDSFRFFSILSAAVDPADTVFGAQDLYVAWTDNRNFATNGTDVMYVKSSNSGTNWGPVTRLSHDPTGIIRDHITPVITVGADSRVHAFWLDRRLDPNNRFFDSWYSSSTDGGATWDPDTRVSTQSQDLNVGFPPGSGNAAGDYWGLDVVGNIVYVAWNDTRNGDQQDILVSRGVLNGGSTATPTPVLPTSTSTSISTPTAISTATSTSTATRTVTSTNTNVLPSPTRTVTGVPPSSTNTSIATSTRTRTATPLATATSGSVTASNTVAATATGTSILATSTSTGTSVPASSTPTIATTATASATPLPSCLGVWRTMPTPAAGTSYSVSALAQDDVWVVGPEYNLYHWDGSAWTNVAYPVPQNATYGSLVAISAWATDDVWAAGSYSDIGGNGFPLVEHWDGSTWIIVGTFARGSTEPVGGTLNNLKAIKAIGPGEAWGVGGSSIGEAPVIRHCTLTGGCDPYSQSDLFSDLTSISGVSTDDMWAVGHTGGISLIKHWDGSAWSNISNPDVGSLNAVEAVSSNDVWASSDTGFMHWDGTAWSVVPSDTGAKSISGSASNDVWAVGTVVQHWDGVSGRWSAYPAPSGVILNSISVASTNEAWAVGDRVLRYSDQRYADVPPDNTFYTQVNYMTCLGIMSGYECGAEGEPCDQDNTPYFRPNAHITRGQLSKIVSNAAGFIEDPGTRLYEDVPENNPFYPYVQRLSNHSVMSGYECGTIPEEPCVSPDNRPYFRPFAEATRGQISKIVANAADVQDPIPSPPHTHKNQLCDIPFRVFSPFYRPAGGACGPPRGNHGAPQERL